MKTILFAAAALMLAIAASAQNPQAAAPHDPVIVFPTGEVRAQLDKLILAAKSKGSSGATSRTTAVTKSSFRCVV